MTRTSQPVSNFSTASIVAPQRIFGLHHKAWPGGLNQLQVDEHLGHDETALE